ncbi:hypothetical protein BCR43DRAFT_488061 [Syncephalastrum racemosum]|uniref:BZIP domain-containing protein n=1 Tax=Syncephalastrum racemosum TaxID=13706 RepID=A0A1X2HI21_SYNRA|nr:hypothetical protein BCR43DRAFT_488061 [Syncephalastrum racemosum]
MILPKPSSPPSAAAATESMTTVVSSAVYHTTPPSPPHQSHQSLHHHYTYHPSGPSSSEQILAEKRRRNAGASSRFRERRKQRERDLQDRCRSLEWTVRQLQSALRQHDPAHPLLLLKSDTETSPSSPSSPGSSSGTLNDRVSQLECMMTRFRQEKETDAQKLSELEQENRYLKSLLVPAQRSSST